MIRSIFLLFLATTIKLSAQDVTLTTTVGNAASLDWLYDCITTAEDGVLSCGAFSTTLDIDPGSDEYLLEPVDGQSLFIQSLSASGNLNWGVVLDAQFALLATDTSENIIVAGYFSGTVDFDPGENEFLATSTLFPSIYILKLDSDGHFLWLKTIDDAEGNTRISVQTSNQGKVMISGNFSSQIDLDPGPGEFNISTEEYSSTFIIQMDNDGTFEWGKQIESEQLWFGDNKNSFQRYDNFGNLYFGATFYRYINFSPEISSDSITSNNNTYENFLVKYNSTGDTVWTRIFGSNNDYEYLRSIDVDSQGNVYCTGRFNSYIDFDEGSFGDAEQISSFSSPTDGYLVRFNADGSYAWSKSFDGEYYADGYTVSVTADNKIVCIGAYSGTIDIDLTANTEMVSAGGNSGIFLFTMDTDSSQLGYRLYQGLNAMVGGSPIYPISPLSTGNGYYAAFEFYNLVSQYENGQYDTLFQAVSGDNLIGIVRYGEATISGCTDILACNYNALAVNDDGSCLEFSPADLDGDCYVGTSDLLILLSYFGCQADCPEADLNNDGIIGVADIIIWIGG